MKALPSVTRSVRFISTTSWSRPAVLQSAEEKSVTSCPRATSASMCSFINSSMPPHVRGGIGVQRGAIWAMRSFADFMKLLKRAAHDVSCAVLFANHFSMKLPALVPFVIIALVAATGAIAELTATRPDPKAIYEDIVQLQIFLDQQLFGPGKIDGRPGEFTTKALKRYQRAHGLPETGTPEGLPHININPVYTTYAIQPEDLKFVGYSPSQPSEQSKLKYLPYDSLLEFLTERFHCAPELLEKINVGQNLERLKPGDIVRVPNVEPFKLEELSPIPGLPLSLIHI